MSVRASVAIEDADRFQRWRRNVPILYDTLCSSELSWGTLSVAFGPALWEPHPAQDENETSYYQRLIYAPRTDATYVPSKGYWKGTPSCLTVGRFHLPRPHTMDIDAIRHVTDGAGTNRLAVEKQIVHPGEVNRIRAFACDPRFVATHTDSAYVFIWNIQTQMHASLLRNTSKQHKVNTPDVVLIGHDDEAPFALDIDKFSYNILSGGTDKRVVLWNLADIDHTSSTSSNSPGLRASKRPKISSDPATLSEFVTHQSVPDVTQSEFGLDVGYGEVNDAAPARVLDAPVLSPRGIFVGHSEGVEDVSFRPECICSTVIDHLGDILSPSKIRKDTHNDDEQSENDDESNKEHTEELDIAGVHSAASAARVFCSSGRDRALFIWDVRAGLKPVCKANSCHDDDVNCVDWSMHTPEFILTGSSDTTIKLHDVRSFGNAVTKPQEYYKPAHTSASYDTGSVVCTFRYHTSPVMGLSWSPSTPGYFASSAEDGRVVMWDVLKQKHVKTQTEGNMERPESRTEQRRKSLQTLDQTEFAQDNKSLLFVHEGHQSPSIVDLHWSPLSWDPTLVASLSDNTTNSELGGGSTMQLWRPNSLVFESSSAS